jgi:hypothetical protein
VAIGKNDLARRIVRMLPDPYKPPQEVPLRKLSLGLVNEAVLVEHPSFALRISGPGPGRPGLVIEHPQLIAGERIAIHLSEGSSHLHRLASPVVFEPHGYDRTTITIAPRLRRGDRVVFEIRGVWFAMTCIRDGHFVFDAPLSVVILRESLCLGA